MALLQKELDERSTASGALQSSVRRSGSRVRPSFAICMRPVRRRPTTTMSNCGGRFKASLCRCALTVTAYHRRTAAARRESQPQTRSAPAAPRQSALSATASFCAHHRLQSLVTVYPNLARGLVLSNINQLWVSDITYIRLRREFVYLAVVLDAYSRRCIGWALSRHIDTELALKAWRMALANRTRATWTGPSFRSRRAVRGRGLRRAIASTPDPDQHEPHRQPL